jgi:hypothetical protein
MLRCSCQWHAHALSILSARTAASRIGSPRALHHNPLSRVTYDLAPPCTAHPLHASKRSLDWSMCCGMWTAHVKQPTLSIHVGWILAPKALSCSSACAARSSICYLNSLPSVNTEIEFQFILAQAGLSSVVLDTTGASTGRTMLPRWPFLSLLKPPSTMGRNRRVTPSHPRTSSDSAAAVLQDAGPLSEHAGSHLLASYLPPHHSKADALACSWPIALSLCRMLVCDVMSLSGMPAPPRHAQKFQQTKLT